LVNMRYIVAYPGKNASPHTQNMGVRASI